MRQALNTIAKGWICDPPPLTGDADAFACNWAAVRFQHSVAIIALLYACGGRKLWRWT